MAQQKLTGDIGRLAVDRSRSGQQGGSIGLVLLIAIVLVGAGVGLAAHRPDPWEPYILALLAVLATVGVFLLFALAAGILRAAGKDVASPLLKSVVDKAGDGILVTDAHGRVIYANAAYLRSHRREAQATCGRSSAFSSAIPACRRRSTGSSKRRARADGCRRRCASAPKRATQGRWLRMRRAAARRRQARAARRPSGRSPT